MNRKQLRSLTSKQAWEFFVMPGETVEGFISEFVVEGYDKNDIKTMVRVFAKDTPITLEHPLMQEDIEYLEGLFYKYMTDHIEKIGGFDKLKLMTEEELEQRHNESVTDLFYLLEQNGHVIKNERIKKMVDEKYYR